MTDRNDNISIPDETLARITDRVLEAEKKKLNLDNPRGIINQIEDIVEEEVY